MERQKSGGFTDNRQTASGAKRERGVWGILPITIVIVGLVYPALLTASILYPLQFVRIALKKASRSDIGTTYALFTMIGKFAAFQGALRFCWKD